MSVEVEEAFRRYGPMVLRRCRQLLKDDQLAEETTQDVFLQMVRHRSRFHDGALSSLLNRIATNACISRLRQARVMGTQVGDEALAALVSLEDLEKRTLIQRLLGKLFADESKSTQVIAVLHYVDGLSLQEVADEVGMSVSGVRKRLRSLKASVRERTNEA